MPHPDVDVATQDFYGNLREGAIDEVMSGFGKLSLGEADVIVGSLV
jgi:hypothetical protein